MTPPRNNEDAEQTALMDEQSTVRSTHRLCQVVRRAAGKLRSTSCSLVYSVESCVLLALRNLFYLCLLLLVDFAAHRAGVLKGSILARDLAGALRYYWTGLYMTESSDIAGEAKAFASHLQLQPGQTICEMGSANGVLMARVGRHVMPGGALVATAPHRAELMATLKAVSDAGLGNVRTYLATGNDWAPGLAPQTCDAIYSRMVVHMVNLRTIRRYVPQWAAALRPGGLMLMIDPNPADGGHDGPPRPIEYRFGVLPEMQVLPQDTEIAEVCKGGHFRVVHGPFEYPWIQGGFGVVYSVTGNATTSARNHRNTPGQF